jgi:metallo-beta-lactamase family protein
VKNGFAGPIYSTPATIDLCNWMLRDTAHIQEKDAEFLNRRLEQRKPPANAQRTAGVVVPLYTTADAERTLPLFRRCPITSPSFCPPA